MVNHSTADFCLVVYNRLLPILKQVWIPFLKLACYSVLVTHPRCTWMMKRLLSLLALFHSHMCSLFFPRAGNPWSPVLADSVLLITLFQSRPQAREYSELLKPRGLAPSHPIGYFDLGPGVWWLALSVSTFLFLPGRTKKAGTFNANATGWKQRGTSFRMYLYGKHGNPNVPASSGRERA